MKNLVCVVCGIFLWIQLGAQIGINPQLGVAFSKLTEEPVSGFDVEGRGGIYGGVDVRIGGRLYLQPGLFISGSKTVYEYNDSLFVNVSEVTSYGAKLKGLVGYKLIDGSFRLRLMMGPTYSFKLSRDVDSNPYFDEEHFRTGSFSLDVGLGFDILFLTVEGGLSYGLTDVFDEDISEVFREKPHYQSFYVTVGILLGE